MESSTALGSNRELGQFDTTTAVRTLLPLCEQSFSNLEQRSAFVEKAREFGGTSSELVAERDRVFFSRQATERRVATLRHLANAARDQQAEDPPRPSPMPLMLVDPFPDVPVDLAVETCALLLQRAKASQVIVATECYEVHRWCASAGDTVTSVDAQGWFAEEHDGW